MECIMDNCSTETPAGKVFCEKHTTPPMTQEEHMAVAKAMVQQQRPAPPTGASTLVCPHCQVRGKVASRQVKVKRGVSGGKAAGAVVTAGWSVLATGLSRKQTVTERTCGACRSKWIVE